MVDLNVDIGEGFPFDDELLEFATSANVCLGAHAGSFDLSMATIDKWLTAGKRVGLHPGYPDRKNMGRESITTETAREYLDSIFQQVKQALRHTTASYIKPHGAFYNDTGFALPQYWDKPAFGYFPGQDPEAAFLNRHPGANALGMLLRVNKLPLMGLPNTSHQEIARRSGQSFIREGFADRAYRDDGTLVPRSEPDAMHLEPAKIASQVMELATRVDSICLHGDTADCVEFAQLVTKTLHDAGYVIGCD